MTSLKYRLRKLETLLGLYVSPLPPLIYDILDAQGLSVGNYLIAGKQYGELRRATAIEVAALRRPPAPR